MPSITLRHYLTATYSLRPKIAFIGSAVGNWLLGDTHANWHGSCDFGVKVFPTLKPTFKSGILEFFRKLMNTLKKQPIPTFNCIMTQLLAASLQPGRLSKVQVQVNIKCSRLLLPCSTEYHTQYYEFTGVSSCWDVIHLHRLLWASVVLNVIGLFLGIITAAILGAYKDMVSTNLKNLNPTLFNQSLFIQEIHGNMMKGSLSPEGNKKL